MKGLCIDSSCGMFTGNLTLGKWYEVWPFMGGSIYFSIIDDNNLQTIISCRNIKTLEDFRDERLVELFG
jgi:hypothetical protein